MNNIAIFASGSGSNAQNIIEHFYTNKDTCVKLVVCNKPDAYVLERARKLNVDAVVLNKEVLTGEDSSELISLLKSYGIGFIVLAGYLLKIPQALISAFEERIVNIHPALLPAYGGKGMYGRRVHEAVVAAGEQFSGITIHLVNAEYDKGKILFQAKCPVLPTDTAEDVEAKIHLLEQEHFPAVIEKFISKQ